MIVTDLLCRPLLISATKNAMLHLTSLVHLLQGLAKLRGRGAVGRAESQRRESLVKVATTGEEVRRENGFTCSQLT